ncbi:MAG: hypothetical protein RBG13Loki_0932 [Promethearchaeota archaeon CR_4]|nr:MAG: hypothetical protein RBG13Loki_0932 [Candidatus Lokiarchaeota archaeon CR_4]
MSENWPYESREKLLEKDLEKIKNQLLQTLLNSNQVVLELQGVQEQLNKYKIENESLKTQIRELNKIIDNLKAKIPRK